jgi:cytochrome o ubiquinol oxidase operon protein cyoD
MSRKDNTSPDQDAHGSVRAYVTGFSVSLLLTVAAYVLVTQKIYTGGVLAAAIITLAIIQLFVQLVFFLHLGRESKPRWNALALVFAAVVVGILVLGSLWIMSNLNYHMTSPQDINNTIIKDEGLKK